jgi:hypothetical protein
MPATASSAVSTYLGLCGRKEGEKKMNAMVSLWIYVLARWWERGDGTVGRNILFKTTKLSDKDIPSMQSPIKPSTSNSA